MAWITLKHFINNKQTLLMLNLFSRKTILSRQISSLIFFSLLIASSSFFEYVCLHSTSSIFQAEFRVELKPGPSLMFCQTFLYCVWRSAPDKEWKIRLASIFCLSFSAQPDWIQQNTWVYSEEKDFLLVFHLPVFSRFSY